MFYYIAGKMAVKMESFAVIDVGGVGYKVYAPTTCLEKIKNNDDVKMYIYTYIREDAFMLYGFLTESELELFEKLIGVSGIGPKAAMAILSVATADRIALAIVTGDTALIKKASGVGPKAAERIVLELKDKLSNTDIVSNDAKELVSSVMSERGSATNEALEALTVLGYTQSEAKNVLSQIDLTQDLELIIKEALKRLVR